MSTAAHPLGPNAPAQFIVVLKVERPDGRTDKLPIDYRSGQVTSKGSEGAHSPDIWTTYEAAAFLAAEWGPAYGVGFVLTPAAGYVVIDLDSVLQADGQWHPVVAELCAALPGAVAEVSQSGRGLHLWARCSNVPPHACVAHHHGVKLEAYSARRFIMLGSGAVGTLADDCPAMRDVLLRYFPARAGTDAVVLTDGPCEGYVGPTDDDELLTIAMRSRSAGSMFGGSVSFADLWTANADALGRKWPADGRPYDASSADAALASHLAFYSGRDAGRIDRLMRRSGLMREKFERPDYLPRTIERACAGCAEVYSAKRSAPAPVAAPAADPVPGAAIAHRYAVNPADPLNTARAVIQRQYEHADGPGLKAWQGSFYRWQLARWVEMSNDDVRAALYAFLDRYGESFYRPTQSKVTNLLDALKSAAHLESTHAPPCWIAGEATAPAAELVACANGLLHLPTLSTMQTTPRFFNLNGLPFNYEPQAAAPGHWLRFLGEVWPNDPEAISTLQELFGYLLTPDTSQQKIFLIVGPKRSGKGTIARVLTEMLGAENVAGPTLASMAGPFGLHPLVGKLAAIISDARLSGRTDQKDVAENLLRISGEDRIEVARKGISALTMKLGVRFVLLTNELPRIADASGAMASRFVILTMRESFLGREDPGLTSKLLQELPGVLSWAVQGWHRLKARGYFVEPRSSAGAAQELADLASPISAFVRDQCLSDPNAEIEVGALFNAWRTWCAQQGIDRPGTVALFGRDLRAAFSSITPARPRVGGERMRVYRGIALSGPRWSATHPIAA